VGQGGAASVVKKVGATLSSILTAIGNDDDAPVSQVVAGNIASQAASINAVGRLLGNDPRMSESQAVWSGKTRREAREMIRNAKDSLQSAYGRFQAQVNSPNTSMAEQALYSACERAAPNAKLLTDLSESFAVDVNPNLGKEGIAEDFNGRRKVTSNVVRFMDACEQVPDVSDESRSDFYGRGIACRVYTGGQTFGKVTGADPLLGMRSNSTADAVYMGKLPTAPGETFRADRVEMERKMYALLSRNKDTPSAISGTLEGALQIARYGQIYDEDNAILKNMERLMRAFVGSITFAESKAAPGNLVPESRKSEGPYQILVPQYAVTRSGVTTSQVDLSHTVKFTVGSGDPLPGVTWPTATPHNPFGSPPPMSGLLVALRFNSTQQKVVSDLNASGSSSFKVSSIRAFTARVSDMKPGLFPLAAATNQKLLNQAEYEYEVEVPITVMMKSTEGLVYVVFLDPDNAWLSGDIGIYENAGVNMTAERIPCFNGAPGAMLTLRTLTADSPVANNRVKENSAGAISDTSAHLIQKLTESGGGPVSAIVRVDENGNPANRWTELTRPLSHYAGNIVISDVGKDSDGNSTASIGLGTIREWIASVAMRQAEWEVLAKVISRIRAQPIDLDVNSWPISENYLGFQSKSEANNFIRSFVLGNPRWYSDGLLM
jgi:hypothetical protein